MDYTGTTVFVCGGGHQGLSMAAHLALNGERVTLWNRTEANIHEVIVTNTINCTGVVEGTAKIQKASTDMSNVVSDVIMVTTPSSAHRDIARRIAPFVHKEMVIILNPGRTFGAIEFAETLLENGVTDLPHIAETQTIVYTCRCSAHNNTTIYALKNAVKIAALRGNDISYIMQKIPACLRDYFEPVDSVIITSLSNVGMVLHCAPVLMNVGWIETEKVDFKYYYDGISKSVAHLLEKIDQERIMVAGSVGCEIETLTQWLSRTYGATGNDIYTCVKTTDAYREIDAPLTIHTRYLLEDVPNGLVPVESIGRARGISTPTISTIIDLASAVLDIDFRSTGRYFDKDCLGKYI